MATVAALFAAALISPAGPPEAAPEQAGSQARAGAAGSATAHRDPRIDLIELQVASDLHAALDQVEGVRRDDPQRAAALGIPYLHADLLWRLERSASAAKIFEDAITTSPHLAHHARFRLAEWALEEGDPDGAMVHLRELLVSKPPSQLVGPAVDLVELAVAGGGDCTSLDRLGKLRYGKKTRRRFDLSRGICAARAGQIPSARQIYLRLLQADTTDDVALHAAERLARQKPAGAAGPGGPGAGDSMAISASVGLSYHHHREFELAIPWLERALELDAASGAVGQAGLGAGGRYDVHYALARSHFWLGRYRIAAKTFADLAAAVPGSSKTAARNRARALYQRARCFELSGRESWPTAFEAFGDARAANPSGGFASASTIARVRLAWLSGRPQESLAELDRLVRSGKAPEAARALIFLASSELVDSPPAPGSSRAIRVSGWVGQAEKLRRLEAQEVDYWRGRTAEALGQPAAAVDAYLETLVADPHHPFGVGAARRLAGAALRSAAETEARRRSGSSRLDHLNSAWLVLGEGDADGARARDELRRRLEADARTKPFLELEAVPTEHWPLWNASLARSDERLLALGLFDEGGSRVLRHFPVSQPSLAYTGGLALARAGATRRSLYIAEILGERIPEHLPKGLLPAGYRQLLHPLRYSYFVLREAERRSIDPYLLAAIIREESRYDPDAFSAASARGLTQFVYPTAREIAERIELGPIEARDIHRPEVAIALGAGYLEQLGEELDGVTEHMVAAYNAGEAQARLWRAYSLTEEPEEYLSKVAFRETRNYLRRVLRSRETYRDLYAPRSPQAAASAVGSTVGRAAVQGVTGRPTAEGGGGTVDGVPTSR